MKNTFSKFGTGIKFQNHKGTKREKNKSARSCVNLKCKRARESKSSIVWALLVGHWQLYARTVTM